MPKYYKDHNPSAEKLHTQPDTLPFIKPEVKDMKAFVETFLHIKIFFLNMLKFKCPQSQSHVERHSATNIRFFLTLGNRDIINIMIQKKP